MHDHRDVRRSLFGDDSKRPHFLGQSRERLGDAVLHLHLREIDVRADLERDGESERAVGCGRRCHVEHSLDAVDCVLEWRADCLREHSWICAGILRANGDRRGRDFGILADRQTEEGEQPGGENYERQNDREDRTVDEEA